MRSICSHSYPYFLVLMNHRTMLGTNHHGPILRKTIYDSSVVEPSRFEKIFSALFYAFSSLGVIFVNKIVLTSYKFPLVEVLATAQFLATTVILTALMLLKKIEVSKLTKEVAFEILPISGMFLANVVFGLGGTGSLNLPMFTALRRFSILFTLIGEHFILRKANSNMVVASVILMVGGALMAAFNDLSYDSLGYLLVFFNNLFTAMSGIYLKQATISGKCNKLGVLYYNSLFSLIVMCTWFFGEHMYKFILATQVSSTPEMNTTNEMLVGSKLERLFNYPDWNRVDFTVTFILAATMGSILNYATFLCTTTNSALTTSVIGCLKNVLTTYIGMFAMGDYTFQWMNFIGLNISIIGSIVYSYVTFNG